MDLSSFRQSFPEFNDVDGVFVQSRLNLASIRMGGPDATVWGNFATPGQRLTTADLAQGFLAAHFLVTSPFGGPTNLAKTDGNSAYFVQYEELERAVAGGFIVAGGAAPGSGFPSVP